MHQGPLPPDLLPLVPQANLAIVRAMGRPRTVLDVGCRTGIHAALAQRTGASVVAIEDRSPYLETAQKILGEVIAVDPSQPALVAPALQGRKFDLIVLSDLLDRVSDPVATLRGYMPFLEREGHVIASVRAQAWTERYASQQATSDVSRQRMGPAAAAQLFTAAGLEPLRTLHNPMLVRALHLSLLGEPEESNPSFIQKWAQSPSVYDFYVRTIRPAEAALVALSPATFSSEHVVVGRLRPEPGPLSLTIGMLTMNEEPSVENMIREIRSHVPDANILCVDSSNDQTPVIAERLGARVIRQLPPRGHGPAMEVLMYEAARETDALIYLDCDFTYPPRLIPTIRRILETGVDVVNASRTRTKPAAMPMANYLANKSFVQAAKLMHGVPISDLHSGLRGYRSSVTHAFSFDGEGDAIPIDTLLWPAKCGYQVVEFPFDYQERVGVSKLRKLAGTAWTLIRLARTLRVGERRADTYQVWDSVEG